jgi:hypothetical protein
MIPLLGVFIFYSPHIFSQQWTGERNAYYWNMWSVNAQAGISSYYGDLSIYDNQINEKIKSESGPSVSLGITKYFNRAFSVTGQVLFGGLQAEKNEVSFEAELLEYNLNLRLDVLNLFNPLINNRFGLVGFAGVGQFLFTTTKYEYIEGNLENQNHSARVPEFVYFAGGEAYYNFNNKLGLNASLSIRQCQNDKLDNVVKNLDFDYYSIFSVGITYYLTEFTKSPPKNKARIAHNSKRLKHLH